MENNYNAADAQKARAQQMKQEHEKRVAFKGNQVKAPSIITAADARTAADSSEKQLRRIYKNIREDADEGMTQLTWDVTYLSEACVEHISSELTNNGFQVSSETVKDCKLLTVKW